MLKRVTHLLAAFRRTAVYTWLCLFIVLVGAGLLVRALWGILAGSALHGPGHAAHLSDLSGSIVMRELGVRLPVPFHVMAVGLFLQRFRLSPRWRRFAWWAVVVSGVWLGLALLARWM
ncbi:MAG: hypothetical protein JXQ27_13940 [Acidobacteria bacterium]|nr:hypothetical protein [Acidobacteriota bacterium]